MFFLGGNKLKCIIVVGGVPLNIEYYGGLGVKKVKKFGK